MTKMKIFIITAVYNNKDTIRDANCSVLSTDYDNLEYIIVDGGSTDGTIEVIRDGIKQYPERSIKFLSENDDGINAAMNMRIAQSRRFVGKLCLMP